MDPERIELGLEFWGDCSDEGGGKMIVIAKGDPAVHDAGIAHSLVRIGIG